MMAVFLSLLLISQFLFATTPPGKACSGSKGNFYAMDELGEKMNWVAKASKGVTAFDYYGKSPGIVGTAVLVSNQGHLLTTGHQLDSCLKDKGLLDKDGFVQNPPAELICQLSMQMSGRAMAKVLFMPACSSATQERIANEFYTHKIKANQLTPAEIKCLRGKDMALVQVGPEHVKDLTCLPLATAPQPLGSPIVALGFPDNTTRRGLKNVENQTYLGHRKQYAMFGEIQKNNECFVYYSSDETDIMAGLDNGRSLKSINADSPGYIQTDLMTQNGNSGGPLLNESGEVIGVQVSSFRPTGISRDAGASNPCRGGGYASPVTSMQENWDMWTWNSGRKLPELKCH